MKEMNSITVTTPMRTEVVGDRTVSHPAKIYKVVREGEKKPLKNLLKWCAALRSGMYKQGKGALRSMGDEYCCLGVLCEVSGVTAEKGNHGRFQYDGKDVSLPETLVTDSMSDTGRLDCIIYAPNGRVIASSDLTVLNDGLGFSFENIADVLELLYYDEQETSKDNE